MSILKQQIDNLIQPKILQGKKISNQVSELFLFKFYPTILTGIYSYIEEHQIVDYKNISEVMYMISNDLICKPKCKCGNNLKYDNYIKGYTKFCCNICAASDDATKQKIQVSTKSTLQQKYGNEITNISQLQHIKDKKANTMLQHYGVTTNSQRYEIKLQMSYDMSNNKLHKNAIKQGIKTKYGVENVSNISHIVEQRNDTFIKHKIEKIAQLGLTSKFSYIKYTDDWNIDLECHDCNNIFNTKLQIMYLRCARNEQVCTICNKLYKPASKGEQQILDFVRANYSGKIEVRNKTIIKGELDIYLPELQLAIEYNGIYWHSEIQKPNDYHLNKTTQCIALGIKLIHIFQDDWENKQVIIKSRLLNLLSKSNKIYARKCTIEIVNDKDKNLFLIANHIQGKCISQLNLGLYLEDELVSLMTFGNRNIGGKAQYELLRFCNKLNYTIIGGANKLFTHFKNEYYISNQTIISYADKCWSTGNLYNELGFSKLEDTQPNYYWVVDGIKQNRLNYTKQNLIKKKLLLDNETEAECMHRLGYYRIYDSGSMKFVYQQ